MGQLEAEGGTEDLTEAVEETITRVRGAWGETLADTVLIQELEGPTQEIITTQVRRKATRAISLYLG